MRKKYKSAGNIVYLNFIYIGKHLSIHNKKTRYYEN